MITATQIITTAVLIFGEGVGVSIIGGGVAGACCSAGEEARGWSSMGWDGGRRGDGWDGCWDGGGGGGHCEETDGGFVLSDLVEDAII